jgi:CBS domain-containing protein
MSTTEPPAEGETLARDIMTTPVITVGPDLSVKDLAALFRDKHIGGAPVVTDGKLVGIVTEGDLMALDADIQYPHYFELFDSIIYLGSQKKFKEQLEKASAATVEQLMTDDVKSVAPDAAARSRSAPVIGPKMSTGAVSPASRSSSASAAQATPSQVDPASRAARAAGTAPCP